ncbi:MAG TPA: T9SS type A sorting domain-containing protein [Bacteroidota bacterium]|nr:T9SS type A sorting domain-containing protein [Bacteroidota bacterium]
MKHTLIKLICSLPILFVLNTGTVCSQGASIIWVRVSDDFFVADSVMLYLINTPNGTWGKDSINPIFQEIEYPPNPPSFDARWVSFATYANSGYGPGFIPLDIRGILSNPVQKDTFVIACTNGDSRAGSANFIFQWPDPGFLGCRCDSMFLIDKTGQLADTAGNPIGKINMFQQSSLKIFQPLTTLPSFKLTIYKYGVYLVDSLFYDECCILPKPAIVNRLTVCTDAVHEPPNIIPSSFRLEQNYPNPFNPSTEFIFSIAKRGYVTLNVYDVLGRTVATIVEEEKNPGRYVVPWNADNIASGVYFYTLRSGIEHDVKKLVILR